MNAGEGSGSRSGEPARVQPKNVVFAALSAGSAVLLLAVLVIVKRTLGTEVFGAFSWALSLATIGEALMDFGVHQVTIRAVARNRSDATRLFRNTLALKALPGALMFVVLTGVAFVGAPSLGVQPLAGVRLACVLLLVSAVLRSYILTVRGVLLGLERFADESLVVIGDRVLLLGAVTLALARGGGLVSVGWAFVAARVVAVTGGLALTHRQVGPPRPAFERDLWRDLQRRALPLGAFLILLNVYNYVDTLLLGLMREATETGLYTAAYRLYEGLVYVPAILSAVVTPRLSHLWSVDRRAHRHLVRTSVGLSIALAVGLGAVTWAVAPWALAIVFGSDAVQSTLALRILAGGLWLVFAIWILQAAAISVFDEGVLLRTTVIGIVANVGLNLWLIPQYGRNGAAWATVAGEALTLALLAAGLRRVLWQLDEPEREAVASDEVEFGNLEANLRFLDETEALRPGVVALEVGSGRGSLLARLRARGLDVSGVDISEDRIREARDRHGELPLQRTQGTALPFDDGAFDVVFSFDVFEHIPDPDAHLAEVGRVLRPGGAYLLQTPNKWTNTIFETLRWRSLTRWRADHCSLHTFGQLNRRLLAHGLAPVFRDVPVVTPFFRAKVRRHLGPLGAVLLAVVSPDAWPRRFRTNFYVVATKTPAAAEGRPRPAGDGRLAAPGRPAGRGQSPGGGGANSTI